MPKSLDNSVDRHVCHARDRTHGRALTQHREESCMLSEGQLVHGNGSSSRAPRRCPYNMNYNA